jgi:hypothetical protein
MERKKSKFWQENKMHIVKGNATLLGKCYMRVKGKMFLNCWHRCVFFKEHVELLLQTLGYYQCVRTISIISDIASIEQK